MSVIKTTIPESRRRWQIDYGKALNVGEGIFSLRRVLAKTEKKTRLTKSAALYNRETGIKILFI